MQIEIAAEGYVSALCQPIVYLLRLDALSRLCVISVAEVYVGNVGRRSRAGRSKDASYASLSVCYRSVIRRKEFSCSKQRSSLERRYAI